MKAAALALIAALAPWQAARAVDDIRFEVPVLPRFEQYIELLEQPGILAIALENNDLSPSLSSKLKVEEDGRTLGIRNAALRYTGRKGTLFTYEAVYMLGVGDTKISFPVAIDTSGLRAGKVSAILSPPLARLVPAELTEKIRLKAVFIANTEAQKKILAYLDRQSKHGLERAVLLDAYNRGGGPMAQMRDVGDALPLSDQWMLILTLAIWLIVAPAGLLWYRLRRRHGARPSELT